MTVRLASIMARPMNGVLLLCSLHPVMLARDFVR